MKALRKYLQTSLLTTCWNYSLYNNKLNAIKCQSCNAKDPATSKCLSCDKFLCGKCLEAHNNFPALSDHVVLTMEELAKPENRTKARGKPRYEKHYKVLKFYCKTCRLLACQYCVDVNHPRPEHSSFPLADIVEQRKEELKASSAIMQQQQEIPSAFTKKLELQTAVLLDQVDMKYIEVNKPLMKQQADMKDYLGKAKSSLDFAKNIISNGTDEEILSLKHEIEEKAEEIEKEWPKLMDPVHNGAIKYQGKSSKDVLENVELNELGKVGMYR